jgi:PadR family transcriptional regulator, regulatory protein AphA
MSLEHAILGFLREQAMSGYDLKTLCFDHDAQHFWTADQAQIYRTLDRLEERNLVRSRVRRQRSRPDRKVYSLTQSGSEELDRWVATSTPLPPLRDPFLIQLRFAGGLPDDELLGLLRSRRHALQHRLDSLRERAAAEGRGSSRDAVLHRLTLEAATATTRASIDWVDDSLESLSALIEQERPTPTGAQRRLFAPRTDERGSTP